MDGLPSLICYDLTLPNPLITPLIDYSQSSQSYSGRWYVDWLARDKDKLEMIGPKIFGSSKLKPIRNSYLHSEQTQEAVMEFAENIVKIRQSKMSACVASSTRMVVHES